MDLISKQDDRVYIGTENEPVTNSLILAREFEKNHHDILRAIRKKSFNYPKSFTERNFAVSEYRDETGKMNRMYVLSRDGFWAVVFGFTGKKAGRLQAEFIAEFNRRADIIHALQEQIRSENTSALPQHRKEYRHKYGYLQMKATADGNVEQEWVSGAKTIAEMNEIENHARLQHKRISLVWGNLKSFISELHPNDRFSQRFVDLLDDVKELAERCKPKAYAAKVIQVPIFSMDGVPLLGLNAAGADDHVAS
ncbi:MAG TPA: Rha family transcriptional regulator [Oligoflexus sp.]|uniref:Rha family transcriptional regulator n=1 Tax=Oligoflexus sp. TaxID=1971216 RepID=UPI002D7FD911|nr:Rha family transcriptional regulator [Oligoflexus sp.]HET9235911.1 Rha family transcriptional regulator [Oligoflexus sp.]